jgi:uncharacterized protein YidB (DUF937 family)
MGLLDDLESKGLNSLEGNCSPTAAAVLHMINNQPGGLTGLIQTFHEKGLGAVVSSWISTGQNLPISAEQIQSVLGNEHVRAFAEKAGVSPEQASSVLAECLPGLIDKLTPNGQLPEGSSLLETGMNLLKSLSKSSTAA